MADDLVIRAAGDDEGDAVGVLTERVYRDGGFVGDDYAAELRDGESRVREATVVVAELDGRIVGSVTAALPGSPSEKAALSLIVYLIVNGSSEVFSKVPYSLSGVTLPSGER